MIFVKYRHGDASPVSRDCMITINFIG